MTANIEIPGNDIEEIAAYLKPLLVDDFVLYIKKRNAYWNVTGPNFDELYNYF